jgi:hypothetical protein
MTTDAQMHVGDIRFLNVQLGRDGTIPTIRLCSRSLST